MDVFRPDGTLTPARILMLLEETPEEGAFVASLRGARVPGQKQGPAPDPDSSVGKLLARRRYRGWTVDRELLAQIRDAKYKKRFPRPEAASDRKIVSLDEAAEMGV